MKFGVLVSHPIQYFVPVYRELARRSDVDLTVIYRTRVGIDAYHDPGFGQTVQWDIPLLDGYRNQFLSDKTSLTGFEPAVVRALIRQRFDVLMVHGYDSLTHLFAIAVAKLMGTRVLIRGDTRLQQRHLIAPFWKRLFKCLLFKVFDGFLAIGSLNREYYLTFGAHPDRVFFAPFCVDNAAFALDRKIRKEERRRVRRMVGLPENCLVILSASKLIGVKRLHDLIHAFQFICERFPNSWLMIVGAGPLEDSLRDEVHNLELSRVRFLGFQNQSDLPSFYAASDIFTFPSSGDQWGLALNEAMAAGLPVIVSDGVGAAPDLVQDKGTGIVYRCGDMEALTKALETLLESEALRAEMGKKARELISHWDVAACVSGIVTAAVKSVS
jgi:glycosyltransferase involved in cell wall biosynthesis